MSSFYNHSKQIQFPKQFYDLREQIQFPVLNTVYWFRCLTGFIYKCCFLLTLGKQRMLSWQGNIHSKSVYSSPQFIELHYIAFPTYYTLYKLKVCGNPVSSMRLWVLSRHKICGSHFGNSCNISDFGIIICVKVICDLWCYFCHCFGGHKHAHVRRQTQSVNVECVLTAPPSSCPLIFPSSWAFLCPETQQHWNYVS